MNNYLNHKIKLIICLLITGCKPSYSFSDICQGDSTTWEVIDYNDEKNNFIKGGYTFYANGTYYEFIYKDSFKKLPLINGLYDFEYPNTIDYCSSHWTINNNLLGMRNTKSNILFLNNDSIVLSSYPTWGSHYKEVLRKVNR